MSFCLHRHQKRCWSGLRVVRKEGALLGQSRHLLSHQCRQLHQRRHQVRRHQQILKHQQLHQQSRKKLHQRSRQRLKILLRWWDKREFA
ncbi:hypothetical protein Mapa_014943 [Marchantia paleacea]|nr:hypothetical protein Mapa_014943 [Marchantia paleacea]